ncbi:hypothetical protein ACIA8E_21460 [Streptomyces sp. NPDC051664]|uniref:hypothetical protein n=1 Tax=Streptomyces sp. NPDC051664 TaxID=3365668 RepID=UPI0037AC0AD2
MTAFLQQLGARIADRWLVNLLLPGLLWLCCAVVAARLGWEHSIDPRAAEPLVRRLGDQRSTAQAVLLVAGVFGAAAAIGLAAIGLGAALRRAWALPGTSVAPARWLRDQRRRRWDAADRTAAQLRTDILNAVDPSAALVGPEYRDALARRESIGLERPQRPTWIGDRWMATGIRIHRAYGLDLTVVWPRLWTLLPEVPRSDIAAAQLAYQESSVLVSWAVLYGGVGLFWWPALIVCVILAAAGVLKTRDAISSLCELVESACDLYIHSIAEQLRVPCSGQLTPEAGRAIGALLRRKDLPPA